MTGLVGLLFGLAVGLWAVKWLLLPAIVIGVGVWALCGYFRSVDEVEEADAAVEAAAAGIAAAPTSSMPGYSPATREEPTVPRATFTPRWRAELNSPA